MSHLGARKPCEPGGARTGRRTRTRESAAAVAERERPLLRPRPWDILEGGGRQLIRQAFKLERNPDRHTDRLTDRQTPDTDTQKMVPVYQCG